MGFFSWKTGDTEETIWNVHASAEHHKVLHFPVVLLSPDGRRWVENEYDGYGVFGGKDIYELIAELNGPVPEDKYKEPRSYGIDITFKDNINGDFAAAADKGLKMPKLARDLNASWESVDYPAEDSGQGFFWGDGIEDEDESDNDWEDEDDEEDDDAEDEKWYEDPDEEDE